MNGRLEAIAIADVDGRGIDMPSETLNVLWEDRWDGIEWRCELTK